MVAATSPCGRTTTVPKWTHVIVIAFENQSYASVLGTGAPASEFTKLAGECGVATNFTAVHYPHSLPVYIAATSGQVSITGDCLPGKSCQSTAGNIFRLSSVRPGGGCSGSRCHHRAREDQLRAITSPGTCPPPLLHAYLRGHLRRRRIRRCHRRSGRSSARFVWIAPDRQNDMEAGTRRRRAWLQNFLEGPAGILTHAPYTAGHTAVFIWFDTGANGDTVSTPLPFIVISPSTPHVRAGSP